MVDPLRISTNQKKISDLSNRNSTSNFYEQIKIMTPSTLYIATSTLLLPIVRKISSQFLEDSISQKPLFSNITFDPKALPIVIKELDKIKNDFQDIETKMLELKTNYKQIMDLLINDKEDSKLKDIDLGLWSLHDDRVKKEDLSNWRRHDGLFGRFFASKEYIKDKIFEIEKSLSILKKHMPNHPVVKKLEEAAKKLKNKIPTPSKNWDIKTWRYNGKKWIHDYVNYKNSYYHVRWKGDKNSNEKVENPIGLLEMTQDPKKMKDFLSNVTESLEQINSLSNKGLHYLMLKSLPTEEAYIYLIVILLPFLQNESAKELEKQGETMKLVSQIYEKWNLMQDLVNLEIKKDNKDSSAELSLKIQNIASEIKILLEKAKTKLPPSTNSLLVTLKELSQQLVTKFPKNFYEMAKNPDQTNFKAYMDIFGQGITALTSISNVTQQTLQIATQYYNSLLGFQKSAQDSVNKTIQTIINNLR